MKLKSARWRFGGCIHLLQHFTQRKIKPTVPFAGTINDLYFERRVRLRKVLSEQVDSMVEIIIVHFAGGDMELAAQLGAERPPVFRHRETEIVFLPSFSDEMIDFAGRGVPQRHRQSVGSAGA